MPEPKTQEQVAAELRSKLPSKKPTEPAAKAPEEKAKPDTQKPGADAPSAESPVEVPGTPSPEKKEEQKPETDKSKDQKDAAEAPKPEAKDVEGHRNLKVEKRIDELVGQIKAERADRIQDKDTIKKLQAELDGLKNRVEKPAKDEAQSKKIAELEQQRVAKYLAEDKELPREERREMSKSDIEEWVIEDPTAAMRWEAKRALREQDERKADLESFEVDTEAEAIVQKRDVSQKRVLQKHPELAFETRAKELAATGKSREEVMKQIAKENPKMGVILQIISEPGAQEKYAFSADGPEQLMQEMERRLEKPAPAKADAKETSEERDAKIAEEAAEAERQRQSQIETGARSTRGSQAEREKSSDYQFQLNFFLKSGKTKADLDRILARREAMNI